MDLRGLRRRVVVDLHLCLARGCDERSRPLSIDAVVPTSTALLFVSTTPEARTPVWVPRGWHNQRHLIADRQAELALSLGAHLARFEAFAEFAARWAVLPGLSSKRR